MKRKIIFLSALLLVLATKVGADNTTTSYPNLPTGFVLPVKTASLPLTVTSGNVSFSAPSNGYLKYDNGKFTWETPSSSGGTITGSGTTSYIPKFTSSSALGISQLFDDGTNVGIGDATPSYKLDVNGDLRSTGNIYADTINTSAANDALELNYKKVGPTIICASVNCATISAYFNTDGHVGIGTNSPDALFEVSGSYPQVRITDPAGVSAMLDFYTGSTKSGSLSSGASAALDVINNAGSHSFVVRQTGNVGIGNSSPAYKLDVTGDVNVTGCLRVNGTCTSIPSLPLSVANGGTGVITSTGTGNVVLSASPTLTGTVDLQHGTLKFGAGSYGKIYADSGGAVSIDNLVVTSVLSIKDSSLSITGAYGTLAIDGNDPTRSIDASLSVRTGDKFDYANTTGVGSTSLCRGLNGSYQQIGNCTSLLKYKTNIQNLPIGLDTLLKLRPVSFDWKDPNMGGHDLGFIAEEVQAVDPLLAEYTNGKLSGVKYSQMSSLLVKSVQDLEGQVKDLQAKNNDLEKRLEALEAKVK